MPFRSQNPLLNLDVRSMQCIDTGNALSLHGLWSAFSKCADIMEDGKRLENLSWRIYSRETFCCTPHRRSPSQERRFPLSRCASSSDEGEDQVPKLSSSLDSDSSNDSASAMMEGSRSDPASARPELRRFGSDESGTRREKHLTPIDLEKIVKSVKEKRELSPLSPLPTSMTVQHPTPPSPPPPPPPSMEQATQELAAQAARKESTPRQSSPSSSSRHQHLAPESSTSTVATAVDSEASELSPTIATAESSTSTEISSTSIVHGFSKDHISRSSRSRTQLAQQPTLPAPALLGPGSPSRAPILKSSPRNPPPASKRKVATFVLGGSSGEGDESSLESRFNHGRSSLSDGLKSKKTSFKDEVFTRTIQDRMYESEEAIDDSDDDDPSESAIEDDDEDWEDDPEPNHQPAPVHDRELFQRVDSQPSLVSRRSLLTTMMHENDRAQDLQNAASRSSPAIRRSRNTSPNGPLGSSPHAESVAAAANTAQLSRARPIIMTTSNTHDAIVPSPRTTRRNMLSTELTGSLRKHLLWERQHKNPASSALLRSRQAKSEIKLSQHQPSDNPMTPFMPLGESEVLKHNNSFHNYFDSGLQEYHEKGW